MLRDLGAAGQATFYRWGRLLIAHYPTPGDFGALPRFRDLERLSLRNTDRLAALHVVRRVGSDAGRDAHVFCRDIAREFKAASIGYAIVAPQTDSHAACFRDRLRAATFATRSPVPHAVFRDVDDALAWLGGLGAFEPPERFPLTGALNDRIGGETLEWPLFAAIEAT